MIVIYGTRHYGQVDGHGGQRQLTRFAHIYFLPLFPVGTLWVTRDVDEGYQGHAVRLSGRSVVAGYARVWGPLAAIGSIASGGIGGIVAGAAIGALSVWSWTWRSVRGAREQRRSDFHLLAYGTRYDPLRMPLELAHVLKADIDERWAQIADGRTPDDVARLGAANLEQAVLAYGALRLGARTAPREHRKRALEASDRILDAIRDVDDAALEGGPYRSAAIAELSSTSSKDGK
jgi:hypothetical protein